MLSSWMRLQKEILDFQLWDAHFLYRNIALTDSKHIRKTSLDMIHPSTPDRVIVGYLNIITFKL